MQSSSTRRIKDPFQLPPVYYRRSQPNLKRHNETVEQTQLTAKVIGLNKGSTVVPKIWAPE